MTHTQERAINLALNVLYVGFFECPKAYYEYFIKNDEWALLMAAAGINSAGTPPHALALAVLRNAVARDGLFTGMTDFKPPAHYCSFLREPLHAGDRKIGLEPCAENQRGCPYATFEGLKGSG